VNELVATELLKVKLTNNNNGQSKHWSRSAKDRNEFELELRAYHGTRKPFIFPVRLVVTRILGPGELLWDYSSIGRGNWKQIEDSLVACGWFVDDGPKFITGVVFDQDSQNRKLGPSVKIEIYKTGDTFGTSKQRLKTAEN
jgi:hypothetical protein